MKKYYIKASSEIGDITLVVKSESEENARKQAMKKHKIISVIDISESSPRKFFTLPTRNAGGHSVLLPIGLEKRKNYVSFE